MGHGIEKALDIRIQHPVHLLPVNPGVESVQRIVLTAFRPETVAEPEELFLVNAVQHRNGRSLEWWERSTVEGSRSRAAGFAAFAPL